MSLRLGLGVAAAMAWVCASCSSGASTFTLDSASVDPTYICPLGSTNTSYDVQATINAHNGTSSKVTIVAVAAIMTVTAVRGSWVQHVGDKYDSADATFTPTAVGAGSNATLTVKVPSACTNSTQPSSTSSYGEYSVTLTVTTSAGTYRVTSKNNHRILAASSARLG